MRLSIRIIVGRTTMVLSCCALAFACLLACLVWGDNQPGGEFYIPFPTLDREVRIMMAISAAVGVVGFVLGMRIARAKQGPNVGTSSKRLP
jgi:uncharacterized membrane protein affecting hemolysin expression